MLNKAIEIAAIAHTGQVDKAGAPYILHPLRVMLSRDNDLERICAVLHDVVEDSEFSFEDLRMTRGRFVCHAHQAVIYLKKSDEGNSVHSP